MKANESDKFPGFPPEPSMNFWSYPKALDRYWHILSGSEQKILDYILRHTWGFKKVADEISITQLRKGIKGLDKGTGLARQTVITALKGLVEKGFIFKKMGKKANCYELVKNLDYPSLKIRHFGNPKIRPTIDKFTIKNKTIKSSSFKEKIEAYKRGERWEEKPYFWDNQMRWAHNKWWVIENREWKEFAGKELEIEWR